MRYRTEQVMSHVQPAFKHALQRRARRAGLSLSSYVAGVLAKDEAEKSAPRERVGPRRGAPGGPR